MDESTDIQRELEQISLVQDFSRLNDYKSPDSWKEWSSQQQETLASLFIQKGESELQAGNGKVFESFQIASQIAPANPNIFYRQGVIYAEHGQNIHCLRYAEKTLEKAVSLHPQYFDALYAWGNVLVQLSVYLGEHEYLHHAHKKFSQAHQLLKEDRNWVKAEFFWHWGKCWYTLATQAGEAAEYKKALDKYQLAAELGIDDPMFWIDYGIAMSDLAHLLNDPQLLLQSAEFFIKANLLDPNDFDAVFHLGCVFFELHGIASTEEFFREADQYFSCASLLCTDHMPLWLKWGVLNSREGKRTQDLDRLEMSFEKFLNADSCEPNHPTVLSSWSEAQTTYGSLLEDYEQLRSAERKIMRALELAPEDAAVWCIYGNHLNEVGRYFNDSEYHLQAAEKFDYAMTMDGENPLIWYGLASSFFAMGEMHNNVPALEKAAHYCGKVIECGGDVPHFWNDWGVTLMKIAEITGNKFYVQSAIEKFKKAIGWPNLDLEQDGLNLDWVGNFASALDFMGELSNDPSFSELSVQIYGKLIQLDPHHPYKHYQYATALSHLAEMFEDLDSFEKAHASYAYYLDVEPEDDYAWNDWGVCLICHALSIKEEHQADQMYELLREAEAKLMSALSLGYKPALYSLACLYSLTGNQALSFDFIQKGKREGVLPPLDVLLNDDWLEGLQETERFRQFVHDWSTQSRGHSQQEK